MNKLTTPQVMDVVKVHHPNVPYTLAAQFLSTAQTRFVRKTLMNVRVSVLDLDSLTVVGETSVSPLSVADEAAAFTFEFFRDDTVPSVTMKSNSSVMFYTKIYGTDEDGAATNEYTVSVSQDGSVLFYSNVGAELDDFQPDTRYLTIEFIKVPANLTVSSSSIPEVAGEYHEALTHWVISELYMARTDMPMIDKLQASKHFRTLFEDAVMDGKRAFRMMNKNFAIADQRIGEFEE